MKKRKIFTFVITIAFITAIISIGSIAAKSPKIFSTQNAKIKSIMSKWGEALRDSSSQNAQKTSNISNDQLYCLTAESIKEDDKLSVEKIPMQDIAMVGNDVLISKSELDQAVKFYDISGYDAKEAREMAETYVKEENALYSEAIKNGYSTTEKEVYAYLEELKATIARSENKDDVAAVIDAYGSEDAYWEYMFTVYTKDLPIQNYVKDQENLYAEKLGTGKDEEFWEKWQSEFESLKNKLVQEEDFKTINEVEKIPEKFLP